jgi:hypothetical protein
VDSNPIYPDKYSMNYIILYELLQMFYMGVSVRSTFCFDG